jgi:tetratricopeptide (TPR) repeat protein
LIWPELSRRIPHGWEKALGEELELPGLRQMITARDLCPLLPRPHMRLAAHAAALAHADKPANYWVRARRLAPFDAELFYYSGVQARKDGRTEEAWDQWKRSLSLSRKYLPAIVDAASAAGLSPTEMLARLLPDDPRVLHEAARRLEPNPDAAERTRPLWERVLTLLAAREEPGPWEYYIKANALRRLDQPDAALAAYRQAVDMNYKGNDWREEYARYLEANRKYNEALLQVKHIEDNGGLTPQLKQFKEILEQQLNLLPRPPG